MNPLSIPVEHEAARLSRKESDMTTSSDRKGPGEKGHIERRRARGSANATSFGKKDPVLSVTDFGPIVEATIDLRPLTVFVGPSNTGKSYLAILIYALHRFFGGHQDARPWRRRLPPFHRYRRRRSLDEIPDLPNETLGAAFRWIEDISGNAAGVESPENGVDTALPERVADLVRPVLNDVDDLGNMFDGEITRCFGVEGSKDLIRRPSSTNARITLRRDVSETAGRSPPFEYEFTMTKKGSRLISSISVETPLKIESADRKFLMRLPYMAKPSFDSEDDDDHDFFIRRLIDTLADLLIPYTVGPVSNPVHYLPADRTGVMHAHRVVVSSLIGRASRAGLRQDAPLPVLSGVLADFLEQLIELGDLPRRWRNSGNHLAERLEGEILGGAVRSERSKTGYPSFYYRPDGWKGDLPLMNTSSMVSELAPVVLYLRHVVQRGDVLIIEEPESHLHPAMQVAFTRLLAAAVRSGLRIIVTTHSEWVLEALANLVRLSEVPKGKRKGIDGAGLALTPDEVGAWSFKPRKRPRGSVVEEIPLDMEGGTFPAGYGEITESLYNDWARISSRIDEGRSR